jgi:hypothetical protein
MPKLLGMEPETLQKAKPLLLIGGGGLLLFILLKGRGTPAVAADAPTAGSPMPMGIQSPAAAPEVSQTGGIVDALQQQLQQHQLEYDTAAGQLALKQQSQQLDYQQKSQEYSLQRQKSLDLQQDAITHEQFKQLKNQGKTGGFFGGILRNIGTGLGLYAQAQGVGLVAKPAQQTQHVSSSVPFYPTPSGRLPGT